MEFVNIVAIIRSGVLKRVEEKLREVGAPGVTVSHIRGYGEYADLYKDDWMVEQIRLDIFAAEADAERIVTALMEAAHTGMEGDGVVAVMPVQSLYHVRTRQKCSHRPC